MLFYYILPLYTLEHHCCYVPGIHSIKLPMTGLTTQNGCTNVSQSDLIIISHSNNGSQIKHIEQYNITISFSLILRELKHNMLKSRRWRCSLGHMDVRRLMTSLLYYYCTPICIHLTYISVATTTSH